MRRRRFLTMAGVAATSVPLAGCGGDSDNSDGGSEGGNGGSDGGNGDGGSGGGNGDGGSGGGNGDGGSGGGDGDGGTDSGDGDGGNGGSDGGNGDSGGSMETTTVQCTPFEGEITGEVVGVPQSVELVEKKASRDGITMTTTGFQIELKFRNTTDSAVSAEDFGYNLVIFDADDEIMFDGRPVLAYRGEIAPGETGSAYLNPLDELDCKSEVARYRVRITS